MRRFVFSGYNTWQPIEQAAGLNGGLAGLEAQLDAAVAQNLTVIRAFGYVVQQGWNMQESTGVYNESLLVRSPPLRLPALSCPALAAGMGAQPLAASGLHCSVSCTAASGCQFTLLHCSAHLACVARTQSRTHARTQGTA